MRTFSNIVNFDRSNAGAFTKTSNGGLNAFLAKFDSNGNLVWINTFGGTFEDEALNVAINSLSEVIIIETVDFDPSLAIQNNSSVSNSTNIFLSKFDTTGSLIWNKTFGSSSNNDASREIAVDRTNNIIFAGFYRVTIDFDLSASIVNLTHSSQADAFITKLDNPGNLIWAKTFRTVQKL